MWEKCIGLEVYGSIVLFWWNVGYVLVFNFDLFVIKWNEVCNCV